MPIKVNGQTSGSVTVAAPDTGSDVTLTLPGSTMNLGTELASKLPIAGGKVLQIVRATDSTQRNTTSGSFVDASLSVTITPQKSDSAILLIWNVRVRKDAANEYVVLRITDNSDNPLTGASIVAYGSGNATAEIGQQTVIGYATPATTSATTYKARFRSTFGNNVQLTNDENAGQLYAIEVSA